MLPEPIDWFRDGNIALNTRQVPPGREPFADQAVVLLAAGGGAVLAKVAVLAVERDDTLAAGAMMAVGGTWFSESFGMADSRKGAKTVGYGFSRHLQGRSADDRQVRHRNVRRVLR